MFSSLVTSLRVVFCTDISLTLFIQSAWYVEKLIAPDVGIVIEQARSRETSLGQSIEYSAHFIHMSLSPGIHYVLYYTTNVVWRAITSGTSAKVSAKTASSQPAPSTVRGKRMILMTTCPYRRNRAPFATHTFSFFISSLSHFFSQSVDGCFAMFFENQSLANR